jgi:putative hydrolase of the HAD superfamily
MPNSSFAAAPIAPSPRLLLFDLDDTLCDYASARALRLRIAFSLDLASGQDQPVGRDLDRMIVESLAMHPHGTDHFPELFRRFGVGDPTVADAAADWYRRNRFHGLALFDDTAAVLSALRDARRLAGGTAGRRIGVITNGPTEVQRAKVELLGIEDLVDFVIISDEFGAAKPDPTIFREALRLGESAAAEAVFVGDSIEHDMAGARASGIRAIWMNRTNRVWPAEEPAPEHMVDNLAALLPLLGDG